MSIFDSDVTLHVIFDFDVEELLSCCRCHIGWTGRWGLTLCFKESSYNAVEISYTLGRELALLRRERALYTDWMECGIDDERSSSVFMVQCGVRISQSMSLVISFTNRTHGIAGDDTVLTVRWRLN